MVAPIASPDPQALYSPLNSDNRPAQVPTEPPASAPSSNPGDQVSISSAAQNLFATAAASDNGQINPAATATYQAQQIQPVADTGTAPSPAQPSDRASATIAAVSNSPQTDASARTAQDGVDAYQQAAQSTNAQAAPKVDEKA